MNPQDAKYIIVDYPVVEDILPVKLEDSWVMARYYASMILSREAIESNTLRVVFSFDSCVKVEGVVNLIQVHDPDMSTSKQAQVMYINDQIFNMI